MKSTHGPDLIRDRPTIGVLAGWQVHAGMPDSFLHQVFRGVHAAAQAQGCNLLLAYGIGSPRGVGLGRPAWPFLIDEADFVPVGPWNADGLIIAPPIVISSKGAQYFQALQAQGYPMVCAGAGLLDTAIVADNEQGIGQAMAHLYAHGHRRIAFVAGHTDWVDSDSARRLAAYRAFLDEAGLDYDPALVAPSAHTTPGGRQAMRDILASGGLFTAVVASNDLAAVGVREVLAEAGLRVPEDVALIGFDDRVEAQAMAPQLTTVHYPSFEVGYQALLLLLRHLRGESVGAEPIRVPTRLVVRESCGCLPGEVDSLVAPGAAEPALTSGGDATSASGVVAALTEAVFNETHRLNRDAVRGLCTRLVETCRDSLILGDTQPFRLGFQQILEEVGRYERSLQGWQTAVSVLREQMPVLKEGLLAQGSVVVLDDLVIETMLHQARLAVSASTEGQRARDAMQRADQGFRLYQMATSFQTAQDEATVVATLQEALPYLGIQHATVALYEAEDEDPVAWSRVQMAQGVTTPQQFATPQRFATRSFPPPGLYPPERPFWLVVTPLLLQGQDLAGFVAFDAGNMDLCADLTWLLASALHGLCLYRAAVEGRRLAEEANRLKGRFLSMVSHELRTPLNLISGLSDLLLRESEGELGDVDPRIWDDLERIYVNAQHLDDLLRDVLDLARDEVGELHLSVEPLELHEVLEPVSVIASLLARDKSLAWRTEIPEVLPRVRGDRTRLRQVLLNLVNNAVKFTQEGEIVLRVGAVAATEDAPPQVRISVSDTGLGIPLDEQAAIFDEFRQSERTTARGYGGLGLGLAICRRLIEMHGGEISVRSSGEVGAGSEFIFTLPAIAQPDGASDDATAAMSGVVSQAAEQVILLVQDMETGRALQAHWFAQGLKVAPILVEAEGVWLEAVLAAAPSAVVLDQAVAVERGWEILRALKQHPRLRRVPALFLGTEQEVERSTLLQVEFLRKPVGTFELGEALLAQGLLTGEAAACAEKTVLVVDDDPESLALHTRIIELQSPAYRVLQARDGREALGIIDAAHPDLVLLDLLMPNLDGFGVLEVMRERPTSRDIPVIVLTGQALTQEDVATLNRGMVSVLSKGVFSQEETLAHLKRVLARQRRSASEAQRFVLRAMAYIHTHYMESISRGDVADHVGVSERHLSRCFRQEIGVTPISYLNRYRVRQAQHLLDVGTMGITDVAMAVGFSSGSYFSRVFRQEMGVSPQGYQQGACADLSDAELS